jgi:hypothetical protein
MRPHLRLEFPHCTHKSCYLKLLLAVTDYFGGNREHDQPHWHSKSWTPSLAWSVWPPLIAPQTIATRLEMLLTCAACRQRWHQHEGRPSRRDDLHKHEEFFLYINKPATCRYRVTPRCKVFTQDATHIYQTTLTRTTLKKQMATSTRNHGINHWRCEWRWWHMHGRQHVSHVWASD